MLRIIIADRDDESFLDTDRWEQFILKHIPQMNKFYFEYHEYVDVENKLIPYHGLVNWFTSLFWIERQWVFELIIDVDDITYIIHPQR
jgi:hypothetical protein